MDTLKWTLFLVYLDFHGMLHSLHCIWQKVQLNCQLYVFMYFNMYVNHIFFCVVLQLFKLITPFGQLRCHPQLKVSLDPVWWSPAHLTSQVLQERHSLDSQGCGPMRQIRSSITQISLKWWSSIRIGQSWSETSCRRTVHLRLIPFNKVIRDLFISGLKYKTWTNILTEITQSLLQWWVSNIFNKHL